MKLNWKVKNIMSKKLPMHLKESIHCVLQAMVYGSYTIKMKQKLQTTNYKQS